MEQDYTVETFEEKGPGQFGSTRYEVQLDDYASKVSLFSKFPITVGDKLFGHIEQITKGDRTYHNFKFAKKEQKPDMGPAANNAATVEIKNILTLKIMPILEKIYKDVAVINEREEMRADGKYPDFSGEDKPPF